MASFNWFIFPIEITWKPITGWLDHNKLIDDDNKEWVSYFDQQQEFI